MTGQVFVLFSKKQMWELFFETSNDIFLSCACTVISSDIIQGASSRFDFITDA